jgi:hypothetical protein
VYFVNDSEGWIVGGLTSSVILHTKNGGVTATGISDFGIDATRSCALEQNYPNPFNSSTRIRYKLNRPGKIALTIYDICGRKIQTLVDEPQTIGEYTVDWDASGFSNGIYFCELSVDNVSVEVGKMMMAR